MKLPIFLLCALTIISEWSEVWARVPGSLSTAGLDENLMRKEKEIPRNTYYIHDPSGLLEPTTAPDSEWTAIMAAAASSVAEITEPVYRSERTLPSCPDSYSVVYHSSVNCTLAGGDDGGVTPDHGGTQEPVGLSSDVHETVDDTSQSRKSAGVQLIVGEGSGVTYLDLDRPDKTMVVNYTNLKAYSVDSHRRCGAIFAAAADKIISTQERLPVVVNTGVEGSVRLAVDWVHDKLYWMADSRQTLEVANLDGSNRTALGGVRPSFVYPNNLTVDPHDSWLFFVSNNSIFRSDLQVSKLTEVYGDRRVRCLAVDDVSKRVYFSGKDSSGAPFVSLCDYDGRNVRDLYMGNSTWGDIYGLDVYRDTLYFAKYKGERDSLLTLKLASSTIPVKHYEPSTERVGIWSFKVLKTDTEKKA